MWRQLNSEVLTSGEMGPKQVNKKIPVSDKYVKKTKRILVSSLLLPVSSPSHKPSRLWKQSMGFCFSYFSLICFAIVANTFWVLTQLPFSFPFILLLSLCTLFSFFLPPFFLYFFPFSPHPYFFKLIDLRVC